VPVDDFVRRVSDTLARSDSLFGSADAPEALSARALTDAADALRRNAAPDMSGLAATGYNAFADQRASALARLADSDTTLSQIIHDAASAENTASAASHSRVAGTGNHVENLGTSAQTPGGQRALIAALQAELGRQQDLVRRHQQRAAELAEQLRLLSYD
jgi:hypothetical protein